MSAGFFLDAEEVRTLTGATTKRLQVEQLRRQGLVFWMNRRGMPVVPRAQFGGLVPPAAEPRAWTPKVLRGGRE